MNIHLFSDVLFCAWVIALIVILFLVIKYHRHFHYRLNLLSETIKCTQGGINKRISENRELLELIKNQYPEILDEHPWVSGWLDSQEKFLVALADKSGIDIYSLKIKES
ncbi:hypothetical protein ET874_23290 [Salmonella enterica subsp. enterica serovar Enteritidis]|nr:hypothetical protein [Salmonella enterica subsp. enterica serovar Enteritidis]